MNNYQYPSERFILSFTIVIIVGVVILTAIPTLFLSPIFAIVMIFMSYIGNQSHHNHLIRSAEPVSPERVPELVQLAQSCVDRVRPGAVQFYVVPSRQRNAYTFGLTKPNVVVIYSEILKIMDADELRFVIGHELGHVVFGHTWLNSILGGMAGIPSSYAIAIVVSLVFRSWNRACEFTSDRAGLIACGNVDKAISALVQLVVGDIRTQADWQQAVALIDREDDSFGNQLGEMLSTHPMIIKRIKELREWAATDEYRRLQARALSGS